VRAGGGAEVRGADEQAPRAPRVRRGVRGSGSRGRRRHEALPIAPLVRVHGATTPPSPRSGDAVRTAAKSRVYRARERTGPVRELLLGRGKPGQISRLSTRATLGSSTHDLGRSVLFSSSEMTALSRFKSAQGRGQSPSVQGLRRNWQVPRFSDVFRNDLERRAFARLSPLTSGGCPRGGCLLGPTRCRRG
jgi:hypothetical protein